MWEAPSKLQEVSPFSKRYHKKTDLSLIPSASDSPSSASPLMTIVSFFFLMCSPCSVSGNEQRSIIHGSPFALTSETVIRSCLNSCYWNTHYLSRRRYIFTLALSKNSSDLKSITSTLPVLVLFIIYISGFCSDIRAWNFDLILLNRQHGEHLLVSRLPPTLPQTPAGLPSSPPSFPQAFAFSCVLLPHHRHSFRPHPLCIYTFLILSYSPSASFFSLLLAHPYQDELHFQVLFTRVKLLSRSKKIWDFTVNATHFGRRDKNKCLCLPMRFIILNISTMPFFYKSSFIKWQSRKKGCLITK